MDEKPQHHQAKTDDDDDLKDPGRDASEQGAASLFFRLNERHRRSHQEQTNRASEQIDNDQGESFSSL